MMCFQPTMAASRLCWGTFPAKDCRLRWSQACYWELCAPARGWQAAANTKRHRGGSVNCCGREPRRSALPACSGATTNQGRYVNAGHLPPLLVKRNAGGEIEIQRLTEGGPVLGLLQGADYRQDHAAVYPGDLLVLYSDGVVEAENALGEQFDEDRLLAVVRENANRSSAEMRDEILRRVHAFLDKEQAQDDLTLIVARIRC